LTFPTGWADFYVLQNGEWVKILSVTGTGLVNATAEIGNYVAVVDVLSAQVSNLEIVQNNIPNSNITATNLETDMNRWLRNHTPKWSESFTIPSIPAFNLKDADVIFRNKYAELASPDISSEEEEVHHEEEQHEEEEVVISSNVGK